MKSRLRPFTFPTHLVWSVIAHSTQVILFLIPQAGAPAVFSTSACQGVKQKEQAQMLECNVGSMLIKGPFYTLGSIYYILLEAWEPECVHLNV